MENLGNGTQAPNNQATGTPTDSTTPSEFTGPEWLAGMPDDLKTSKSLGKFKDVENLARGYVNAEQLLGRDKIPMPKTDAEFAEVYAKLGCPADVKEYKIQIGETLPNLDATIKEDLQAFLPMAKELGLNNRQANTLFNKYIGQLSDRYKELDRQRVTEYTRAEQELRTEYGETYDTKLTLVNRMLTTLGGEEVVNAIAESGLGRNPAFIRMMVKLGEANAEQLGIDKTGNSSLLTPSDIRQQIAELQAHPAYMDASHPEHKLTVERVQQLFQRAAQK